jgi:glutathione synthase/RimK-type ligase-like ATP-grasp enzyme
MPNDKIAVARDSLRRAEQSGAPEFAPVELATARDKLARAEKAVANHDAEPATQLAEQADVDARLAEATANQQRAHKAAVEFDASMAALRQESMRATPPAQ